MGSRLYKAILLGLVATVGWTGMADGAAATTAFMYQGWLLDDGQPMNGTVDLAFRLYDAETSGTAVGSELQALDTPVEDGYVAVELDFGSSVFAGQARWLQITVNGVVLTPRQAILAAPYAIRALTAPPGTASFTLTGSDATYTAGNVGIGTTTPGQKLTVNGNLKVNGWIGTDSDTAVQLYANNNRVLWFEHGGTSPNIVGGAAANAVTDGVLGGFIGGGGTADHPNTVTDNYGTVSGGFGNTAGDAAGTTSDAKYATVGGGIYNDAVGQYALVGGGMFNVASGQYATVGGGYHNDALGEKATAGGGENNQATGTYATVGGGYENEATASRATVAGGYTNSATGAHATVGGGYYNGAAGEDATVAGGYFNSASGEHGTVAGGEANSASGQDAAIPGGYGNTASGTCSFAGGNRAQAAHNGAFVWGDYSAFTYVASTAANQFIVRAGGGMWFGTTSSPSIPAGRFLNTSTGGYLTTGGTWTNSSDKHAKSGFEAVDPGEVLDKVTDMPITTWRYNAEDASVRHMGPMAQDFHAAFGLGDSETAISTIDAQGVALAAIQGLRQELKAKDGRIAALEARLAAIEARMAAGGESGSPKAAQ